MIGDTIAVTFNAVAKTLKKINQDSYGADYFLREAAAEYLLTVRHTIPKGTGTVESHMVRIDVWDIVLGVKSPAMSAWLSFKTDGAFDATVFKHRVVGLADLMNDGTLVDKLIGRES
jgi:hypothetical protein